MLGKRLIVGVCLIALVTGAFWAEQSLESRWPDFRRGSILMLLAAVFGPIASREFVAMARSRGAHPSALLISLSTLALAGVFYLTPPPSSLDRGLLLGSVIVLTFLGAVGWHARGRNPEGAMISTGLTLLASVYFGLCCGFLIAIRQAHSAWVVLAVILITKMGDTGAYFTGRLMGRHKLIFWLSPGKTWEGLAGAMVWSAGFSAGSAALGNHLNESLVYAVGPAAIAGAVLALIGHAGDLTMSLFKRDAGIKDSGSLLPGMGGILDVLDSPLLAAPAAYWLLQWVTL